MKLTLEQLKVAWESDMEKRNAAQEQTIKEQRAFIDEQTKTIREVELRCYIQSYGKCCVFCQHSVSCGALSDKTEEGVE